MTTTNPADPHAPARRYSFLATAGAWLALTLALTAPTAAAWQVTPAQGDLFLYSPAFEGGSSSDGALVRYDPLTGIGTLAVDTFTTPQKHGSVAWDPVRGGLLFVGGITDVFEPTHLWMLDGQGQLQDLGQENQALWCMAPASDGKVYMRRGNSNAGEVRYLDTDGVLKLLMDASGAVPFKFVPGNFHHYQGMIYHAPTHSLVCTGGLGTVACNGGTESGMVIRRATLSADGTRVVGSVLCNAFEVSSSGETPRGISLLPGGDLLVVVDTNSNSAEPRMLRVDPFTLDITVFASSGSYSGAAAVSAGTWSNQLGKAVLLDSFADDLRLYAAGESGSGVLLGVSPNTSTSGGTGETATLIEIDSAPCPGGWSGFGAGLAGLGGFEPTLSGTGCPIPGNTVTLHTASARGGAQGALFVGLSSAALPFKGGTLHVAPVVLTISFVAGGTPDLPGAGSLTIPATLPADPSLSGVDVILQAVFADIAAPVDVSLTGALVMSIG